MIRRGLLLFLTLLTVTACTTQVHGTPSASRPQDGPYWQADLCGFVKPADVERFGTLQPDDADRTYTTCSFFVGDGLGSSTFVYLWFPDYQLVEQGDRATTVNGVRVYLDPADKDLCRREIAAAPGVEIHVNTSDEAQPCAVADAVTAAVTATVRGGTIPQAVRPPGALSTRDACTVLDKPRAPGAKDVQYPGFGGHSCTWGAITIIEPSVRLELRPYRPVRPDDPDRRAITIAGRTAWVRYLAEQTGNASPDAKPTCDVAVDYQPLTPPVGDLVDGFVVTVTADGSQDQLCGQATDLATMVIENLSG